MVAKHGLADVEVVSDPVGVLFSRCHIAIVASGTVTLEAAIHGTPMIITYKVSPFSYFMGKALVKVDHIGLVNLIARERIVPELIQDAVTAEAVSEAAYGILADPETYAVVCKKLNRVRQQMGGAGASQKVAQLARSLMA